MKKTLKYIVLTYWEILLAIPIAYIAVKIAIRLSS